MYYCEFPDCQYKTSSRTQIQYHHIISKSKNGSNLPYNRIWLCPSCHTKIYIPGENKGIHSKYNESSIVLIRWANSTNNKVLIYRTVNSLEELFYQKEL